MAVDINQIYFRFRQAVIEVVGPSLAQVAPNTPAVFIAKDRFPANTYYPMVIIDVGNRRKQGSHTTYQHYNAAGDTVNTIAYDYFVTITVFTDHTENAQQLADDLEASFVRNDITEIFTADGFGTPAETFGVDNNYFKEGDEVKQISSFNVRFTAANTVIETEPSIENVDTNLVFRYPDSDTDIVSGTIQTQNP